MTGFRGLAARAVLVMGLTAFYLAGASTHARVVNNFKARGDQNGYLSDAEDVYANRHGQTPPILIGERNRMPLYAGFQALFYDPHMKDPEFFEVAKTWNIRLSLVLIAFLFALVSRYLPPLLAANLTLIIAFGYFIFRAGYVQAELLFYFLFFTAFLACCLLFTRCGRRGNLTLAILAGVFAALAQLTKASVLPFVVIFLAVYGISELTRLARGGGLRRFISRATAGALMAACFFGVLYPYISTSKRVFGQYFYNVNTTFYVWYNDWPEASVGTHIHGDGAGWPDLPPEQIPSLRGYWRSHTSTEIAERVVAGFEDMVDRSYQTFWYMKYVAVYLALAMALVAANREAFGRLVRAHAALLIFLTVYGAIYLMAIAFYFPISGTGTARFLLPHVAPLLFALSYFFAMPPFAATERPIAGVSVTPAHFQLLVSAMIGTDLVFTIWPRLLTTYGGF